MAGLVLGIPSWRPAEYQRQLIILGAVHFAWQAQHLEPPVRFYLAGAVLGTSGSFCVAGTALRAPPARFAWQAQHLKQSAEVWRRLIIGIVSLCVAGAALGTPPVRFMWQAQHLEYLQLVLHGRRSTWSSFRLVMRGKCRTGNISVSWQNCRELRRWVLKSG